MSLDLSKPDIVEKLEGLRARVAMQRAYPHICIEVGVDPPEKSLVKAIAGFVGLRERYHVLGQYAFPVRDPEALVDTSAKAIRMFWYTGELTPEMDPSTWPVFHPRRTGGEWKFELATDDESQSVN